MMDKNAKIYVAGHKGMVGFAIVRELKKQGYHNIITRTHKELDLIDQVAVEEFFAKERPEYVFLAAAKVGGIMANSSALADFMYDNMMLEMNVIHSAWKHGCKKLEFLGSSCIYPRMAPQPMSESCLLTSELEKSNEAYALAKISGLKYCEYLNHVTKVPLDVHLMVKDIKNYIDSYQIFNPNIISFHCEACKDEEEVQEIIKYAKDKVRRVGIAIKPDTNIEEIYKYLPYIHVALVMTVNPGEGGQMLIPETIEKIKILSEYREKNNLNYDIEADGGVKLSNSKELIDAGADILVSGSGILESKDYAKTIKELRV